MNKETNTMEPETRMSKATRKKAEELMRVYAQSERNLKALQATIANELNQYKQNMKEAAEALIDLGGSYRIEFDGKGNFDLGEGYLHIANSAVIVTSKKFDWARMLEERADWVDIDLKTMEIKRAFQDAELRKELKSLGIQLDNSESIEVKTYKPKT